MQIRTYIAPGRASRDAIAFHVRHLAILANGGLAAAQGRCGRDSIRPRGVRFPRSASLIVWQFLAPLAMPPVRAGCDVRKSSSGMFVCEHADMTTPGDGNATLVACRRYHSVRAKRPYLCPPPSPAGRSAFPLTDPLASLFFGAVALIAVDIPLVYLLSRALKFAPRPPALPIHGGSPASQSSLSSSWSRPRFPPFCSALAQGPP